MDEEFDDQWAEEQVQIEQSGSLFEKKVVNFTNDVIEINLDRLMERPILNQPLQDYQNEEDDVDEKQMNKQAKQSTKNTEMQQALFNPIQDEQNQKWIKKHSRKNQKPLNCPSCFNQLAYDYQLTSKDQNDRSYTCKQVFGIQVRQNKIIRETNISETMKWQGVDAPTAEQQLRLREQAINVKILAQCNCGYSVGYYDINKDCFVLVNVL